MRELGASPLRTFSIGFKDASYNELEHARRIACANNLKQIGLGIKMYAGDHGERFPDSIKDVSRYVDIPSGDPAKKEYECDPSRFNDDLMLKIRQLIAGVPGFETRGDNIIKEVRSLDNGGNIVRLMAMLQP
jgi:hypothetical protein